MALYKYVTAERIDILQNELIRFTQAEALNDVFEVKPHIQQLFSDKSFQQKLIDPDITEPNKVIDKILPGVLKNFQSMGIQLSESETRNLLNQLAENNPDEFAGITREAWKQTKTIFRNEEPSITKKLLGSFNDNVGILSLTETSTNILMWSHYAGEHTGFVIGFDDHHPFFTAKRSEQDDLSGLHKILYTPDRPNFKELTSFLDKKDGLEPLLFTKSKEWEYEQEWRVEQLLRGAGKVEQNVAGKIHLFALPASCVKSISLGSRMSEINKKEILHLIKADNRYSHVSVLQAALSDTSYCIELKAI